ncbi:MAG: hypothetical protein ORN58_00120, partial [Sediminibacterium sp.]|nr:hypothetical protein [Sediminibacterium sp.]
TNVPFNTQTIIQGLDSLQKKIYLLNIVEQKELRFYEKMFAKSTFISDTLNPFIYNIYPIIIGKYFTNNRQSFYQTGAGINIFGSFSKNWSYQLSFQDVNVKADNLQNALETITNQGQTGINSLPNPQSQNINFSELRTHLIYSFKNGYIDFGQDYQNWGEGVDGKIVLSSKAPTYPYLKVAYKPVKWLKFSFMLAWLHSKVLDSGNFYNLPQPNIGAFRESYVDKYLSTHSIDFQIKKGLTLSLGESVIFSDKFQFNYIMPFNFFKAAETNLNLGNNNASSNGQFFAQINSRNQIKNTQIYATLFIDEIRIATIFDSKKNRNQLAYTIGVNNTDLILSNLTVGIEYTKIRPFVYSNFIPAQTYQHYNYSLGYWLPNNSDRVLMFINYTPVDKLYLQLRYSKISIGNTFNILQQYTIVEEPQFLEGGYKTTTEWYFKINYQVVKRGNIFVEYSTYNNYTLSVGLNYGL